MSLQTTISNLIEMAESCPNWKKTLQEKEKMLVTGNFSFFRVFKLLVLQTHKNRGLFGKVLKAITAFIENNCVHELFTTQSMTLYRKPCNPSPNKPLFLCVRSPNLLTLWEKEKLLITSNFTLSNSVFFPFWRTFCHFHQIWNCRLKVLASGGV